jgi:hypothetical protein
MKADDEPGGVGSDPDTQWERVAAELRAYREEQRRAWGDLDEAAIARYVADEATVEDRGRVEQAMLDFPRVRECVDILQEVMTAEGLGQEDHTESAGKDALQPSNPTPSKEGRLFSPSSVRRLAPYALAACLLLAVGLTLLLRPIRDPTLGFKKSAEPRPQIVAMKIEQYRGEGVKPDPIGTIGVDSPSAREKDLVRVSARLDKPAYCYVIAFNPDGHDQLYYPRDRDVPPPKSAAIEYPAGDGFFSLTDGAGLQAFVLIASTEPLPPYERWRAGLGEVPWQPTQADGVWRSGGRGIELALADTARSRSPDQRGPTEPSQPPPLLSQLYRFLGTRPGVAAVRALAFPVKPDQATGTPRKPD